MFNQNFISKTIFPILLIVSLFSDFIFPYEPNWNSLDKRPLPEWFDRAKIGIFVHWGVYSVPSFGSEWFWLHFHSNDQRYLKFMHQNYRPSFTYAEFANDFTAELFNATEWANIFKESGARYVVLTSKHHEGYTLWPSKYSFNWNAKDVGPNRDLVGELSLAVRNASLVFGLYHSLFEWFNPLYLRDKANNFTTNDFVQFKVLPEMKELVQTYRPFVFWSDGEWEAADTYWNSGEFLAWLYNESPVKDQVVVNDRWGKDTLCKHGGYFTCQDRYNPGVLQEHKFENALTLDKYSWGYRREAKLDDYLTIEELITNLVQTVSCGGNVLINVGPTKYGKLMPIFEERLRQLGQWLKVNGEAIYDSRPWTSQQDSRTSFVWYTKQSEYVYAISLEYPSNGNLILGDLNYANVQNIQLLGSEQTIKFNRNELNNGTRILFPPLTPANTAVKYAFVFRINYF